MPGSAEDQLSAGAGQAAGSTPAGPAADPAATQATDAEASAAGGQTIAPSAAQDERDAAAFERLRARAEGREAEPEDDAGDGPAEPPAQKQPAQKRPPKAGAGARAAAAAGPADAGGDGAGGEDDEGAAEAAADDAPRTAGFETLSDASYQALHRTGLLPTAKSWAEMPTEARRLLIRAAQGQISANSRAFAARQKLEQQQAPRQPHQPAAAPGRGRQPAQQATEAGDVGANSLGERAAAGALPAQGPATIALPDIDAVLSPVADYLGNEGLAPIKTLFVGLRDTIGQLQTQHATAMQQVQQQNAAQLQQLAEQAYGAEAQRAIDELRTSYGEQVDFDDPGHYEPLLHEAVGTFNEARAAGRPLTWHQAIVATAKGRYGPKEQIRQAEQQKLMAGRARSLRQTPERGTTRPAPPKPATQDDKDKYAFDNLGRGVTTDRTRATLPQ